VGCRYRDATLPVLRIDIAKEELAPVLNLEMFKAFDTLGIKKAAADFGREEPAIKVIENDMQLRNENLGRVGEGLLVAISPRIDYWIIGQFVGQIARLGLFVVPHAGSVAPVGFDCAEWPSAAAIECSSAAIFDPI